MIHWAGERFSILNEESVPEQERPPLLPVHHIPRSVYRVPGCDCGGLRWHRQDCTLRDLPREQQLENIKTGETCLRNYLVWMGLES